MKKRPDGRYQAKITLPGGKTKFVYGRTIREVNEKKEALKMQYAPGVVPDSSKITLQEWAEKWWKTVKEGKTGNSSQEGYLLALNKYIFPALGNMKLKDVRPIHVQNLINQMGEQGKSKSLQRQVLVALNGMFKYAVRNGLISGNPAQYTEYYEVPANERQALTPAQVAELLEACKGTRAELAIHLALYCGLRRGEIVALKWSDLDENTRTIHVKKAVEFVNNQPKEKSPKSKAGERIIPVPPHLWDMLQSQPKKSMFVIPSAQGTQMTKTAVRRLLEPIQKKVSFYFTWHMLRHTYATTLDKIGIPPKTCQYLLGHADLSTTKDIYTHIQDEHITQAARQIQNIYHLSKS
ncbi:MAG: tyrosine-type recombinase/integrase [Syntrophothermus sp.]|uniref:site-specific integrase n=1 Tax=Syntrophothermus sp. TaxID=2736299 RepID=UPI00257B32EC|nr:site-specific integrase [Syntrophothermus sp.]NSW83106.1 tyrosine-type recombinase/integrase [Syntrophothermus sp.]